MNNSYLKSILAVAVALGAAPLGFANQCDWNLVWSDEFSGSEIDVSKWSREVNGSGGGNNEKQYYTDRPENAFVNDGVLTIKAQRESYTGDDGNTRDWTSARLRSRGLGDWTYGKVETRLQLPSDSGVWPAIWMLPTQWPRNTHAWPWTGEIDVMETINEEAMVHGTLHYGRYWPFNTFNGNGVAVADKTAWHTYAIEWLPGEIRWYLDGELYSTKTTLDAEPEPWIFDGRDYHLIMNLAMGGAWPENEGGNVDNAAAVQTMNVDYVRVYKDQTTWSVEGDNHVYRGEHHKVYRTELADAQHYEWHVPTGASIVSGQGTSAIVVAFSAAAESGDVVLDTILDCATQTYRKPVLVEQGSKQLISDHETVDSLSYKGTGTATVVANPSAVGLNTSANVMRYVRNATETWDNLQINGFEQPINIGQLKSTKAKLMVDVYTTDHLIGKDLSAVFELGGLVDEIPPWNGITGRALRLNGTIDKVSQWHTVQFEFSGIPDAGIANHLVDRITLMVEPGRNLEKEIYFDNLRIVTAANGETLERVLEDHDGQSSINLDPVTSGVHSLVPNPKADAVNDSATVMKYERDAGALYDVLFYNNVTVIPDADKLKQGEVRLLIDIYTDEPVGETVLISVENEARADNNDHPVGRSFSIQAVTTVSGQWETLAFNYNTTLDYYVKHDEIDQLAILFKSGQEEAGTYFIDNIRLVSYNQQPPTGSPSDVIPPTQPGVAVLDKATTTSLAFHWSPSMDDSGAVIYQVWIDNEIASTSVTAGITLTNLAPNTSYKMSIVAEDAAGNKSIPSDAIALTTLEDNNCGEENCLCDHAPEFSISEDGVDSVSINMNNGSTGYVVFKINGVDHGGWFMKPLENDCFGFSTGSTPFKLTLGDVVDYKYVVTANPQWESNWFAYTFVGDQDPEDPETTVTLAKNNVGDVVYSVVFPEAVTEVQIFARPYQEEGLYLATTLKQGDVLAENAEEIILPNGTVEYRYTHAGGSHQSGDQLQARFYGYAPSIGQLFYPGPGYAWSEAFTY